MSFAGSRWNSRKSPVCNVSDSYVSWLLLCQNQCTNPGDTWDQHYRWLLKAGTYIRIKFLADYLQLYDRKGLLRAQDKDPTECCATDAEKHKEQLILEIQGYALTPADKSQESSIVRRAMVECKFDQRDWHIQRGLSAIGYKKGLDPKTLELKVDGQGIKFAPQFSQGLLRDAFVWCKKFGKSLEDALKERFVEEPVWRSLRELTAERRLWDTQDPPIDTLKPIAAHCKIDLADMEIHWKAIRREVVQRLKVASAPRNAVIPGKYLHSSILLPALMKCEPSPLRKLLVTAISTSSITAQLERDNKALRTRWDKKSKKIGAKLLGEQVRLCLNFDERCGESSTGAKPTTETSRLEARKVSTEIMQRYEDWKSEFGQPHRDGHSFADDQESPSRTDAGGSHRPAKRKAPEHTTDQGADCFASIDQNLLSGL